MTSAPPSDLDAPAAADWEPPPSTVAYLFRNTTLPAITSTVMALAVAYFLRGHFPDLWLLAWLAVIVLVNGVRYVLLSAGREIPPGPSEAAQWMMIYLVSVGAAGIAWGAAGWVFFPVNSVPLQVFLAFILGGMAVGAMASYGAWLPAFFAYTVPSLTPITVRFLWETDGISVAMGGMVAVFTIAISFLARNVRSTLRRSYDLQMTHDLILDAVGEGVYGVNREGRFTFINPPAAHMLGWDAHDLVGKVAHDVLRHAQPDGTSHPPDDHPDYAAFTDGTVHRNSDGSFWRRDGSTFPVEYVSTPMLRKGEDEGAVVVFRDITDRKLAEDVLRQSEERHREFAANAAHELRTPLAVLRSNLDNLDDGGAADSLRHDVDSMARLVEQMLAATRLDILAVEDSERADLGQVCRNVAENLAPIAISNRRSIEVVGCTSPVNIRGNGDALEQAVRNLVENGLRYSAVGTTVTIEVRADASVSIIDHGPGIPIESRDAIFERFHRLDHTSGGAGLGLAIVHRTVEAHTGSIAVADAPDGGAVFTMRFPSLDEARE
jgi:PAS domain S-box-containing protein